MIAVVVVAVLAVDRVFAACEHLRALPVQTGPRWDPVRDGDVFTSPSCFSRPPPRPLRAAPRSSRW